VGLIPGEVIGFFFNLPNAFNRTMALGSTQPLTEMGARNLPPFRRLDEIQSWSGTAAKEGSAHRIGS
jgi:hypothetical protein